MKKNLKLLVIGLLVAVAATLTCALMPACGGGNTADGYSVTVTCDDDIDFTQITPQWCIIKANGETGSCSLPGIHLDANGKYTYKPDENNDLKEGEKFHVALQYVPAGYDYEDKEIYVTSYGNVDIKLIKTN